MVKVVEVAVVVAVLVIVVVVVIVVGEVFVVAVTVPVIVGVIADSVEILLIDSFDNLHAHNVFSFYSTSPSTFPKSSTLIPLAFFEFQRETCSTFQFSIPLYKKNKQLA